jgi:hypothetical protein
MLIDFHDFRYVASVPWPGLDPVSWESQATQWPVWDHGVELIETWLVNHVGPYRSSWAWNRGQTCYEIGVGFRWDQDRLLFVLTWK